jgi:hypothetical protein
MCVRDTTPGNPTDIRANPGSGSTTRLISSITMSGVEGFGVGVVM